MDPYICSISIKTFSEKFHTTSRIGPVQGPDCSIAHLDATCTVFYMSSVPGGELQDDLLWGNEN